MSVDPREMFEALAVENERAVLRNHVWRDYWRQTLPPGRARRSRLWLLAFYTARAERRAAFWRELAEAHRAGGSK